MISTQESTVTTCFSDLPAVINHFLLCTCTKNILSKHCCSSFHFGWYKGVFIRQICVGCTYIRQNQIVAIISRCKVHLFNDYIVRIPKVHIGKAAGGTCHLIQQSTAFHEITVFCNLTTFCDIHRWNSAIVV